MFHFDGTALEFRISPIVYKENCLHPYCITVTSATNRQDMEIRDWLTEMFNDDDYFIHGFEIRFMHEKHAQWFIMRWS